MASLVWCSAAGCSTSTAIPSLTRPPMQLGSSLLIRSVARSTATRFSSRACQQKIDRSSAVPCISRPSLISPPSRRSLPCPNALPVEAFSLAEGVETPLQLAYLATLLGILSVGAFLVVRQILVRRELDEAAKALGERIRNGGASCEDYFELGVILTRKKLFTQATKNLEKAKKLWDGEESEKAQVHNALGFCYFNMNQTDMAIQEYRTAVGLQPGYVTAWNNLGDALEREQRLKDALEAYRTALSFAPGNKVALSRSDYLQNRVARLRL